VGAGLRAASRITPPHECDRCQSAHIDVIAVELSAQMRESDNGMKKAWFQIA
jgi:hypothetical protein